MKNFLNSHLYDKLGEYKISILYSPLFIVGLVLKLYASAIFAGTNFGSLFIPFLKYFSLSGFQDPYAYFYSLGISEVFPYPQTMLYIMSLPGVLFKSFLNSDIFYISHTELFLYHLPILVADVVILLILARWFKNKHKELLWLYWLSPILFYINYLHSQLDVIPMAFVFIFLYFLFKEHWLLAFTFLGIAIATKFHILILVPFSLVYLWRKQVNLKLIAFCGSLVVLVFLIINNVHLLSPAFQNVVFHNREQLKIFNLQLVLGDASIIYIIPLAYTLLFLNSLSFPHFNRDTFVMFLGFSFGILTLFIPPMQGWYYWIVPFFIYFYIKNEQSSKIPFVFLTAGYFLYFALTSTSDYFTLFQYSAPSVAAIPNLYSYFTSHGWDANTIQNLGLTLLQAALLVNVFWLYRRGVEESKKRKLHNMPYLIGIAGDSGSGKSTLAKLFISLFGEKNVAVVEGDAMHKWERGDEMWQKFTHLNPRANKLHDDIEHAMTLQAGGNILRRHYDHSSGTFTLPKRLDSKKIVLFEGLHSFYLTKMQQALDLKIFIVPEEQLRIHWKLKRDIHERGYVKEVVLESIKKREEDSSKYIAGQQEHADITISLKCKSDISKLLGDNIDPETYLEIRCDNTVPMDALLEELSQITVVEHIFDAHSQIIRFTEDVDAEVIERLSLRIIPEIYDIVVTEPEWTKNHNGILQLFLGYYILRTLRFQK